MEIKRGIDKLLKKLNKIYFKMDVLKYTLPDEITRNKIKAAIQNLINTRISDFFVFGQEKMIDFDNSMNSFVGCCSLGTGQLDSFMKYGSASIQLIASIWIEIVGSTRATTLVGVKKYILGDVASTLDKYFKFVFDVDIMRPYVY